MELAKVTSKGQITIPTRIREKLGIKEGGKVLFLEEDVVALVKELRKEKMVK